MLSTRGLVDFDDLVVEAANPLNGDLDEFQDVDAAQLRLVRLLAEPERNLFVVGDDDQP